VHGNDRHQDCDGQRDDCDERATEVEEKENTNQTDDDRFFDKFVFQCLDGFEDQLRAVVHRNELYAWRQRRSDRLDLFLHALDDGQGILAETDHDDPANNITFAVQICETASDVRTELYVGDIAKVYGSSIAVRSNGDLFDVLNVLDVAEATHHVFAAGHFNE